MDGEELIDWIEAMDTYFNLNDVEEERSNMQAPNSRVLSSFGGIICRMKERGMARNQFPNGIG